MTKPRSPIAVCQAGSPDSEGRRRGVPSRCGSADGRPPPGPRHGTCRGSDRPTPRARRPLRARPAAVGRAAPRRARPAAARSGTSVDSGVTPDRRARGRRVGRRGCRARGRTRRRRARRRARAFPCADHDRQQTEVGRLLGGHRGGERERPSARSGGTGSPRGTRPARTAGGADPPTFAELMGEGAVGDEREERRRRAPGGRPAARRRTRSPRAPRAPRPPAWPPRAARGPSPRTVIGKPSLIELSSTTLARTSSSKGSSVCPWKTKRSPSPSSACSSWHAAQ